MGQGSNNKPRAWGVQKCSRRDAGIRSLASRRPSCPLLAPISWPCGWHAKSGAVQAPLMYFRRVLNPRHSSTGGLFLLSRAHATLHSWQQWQTGGPQGAAQHTPSAAAASRIGPPRPALKRRRPGPQPTEHPPERCPTSSDGCTNYGIAHPATFLRRLYIAPPPCDVCTYLPPSAPPLHTLVDIAVGRP